MISPGTEVVDRGRKFEQYRALPSLDQVVFIEPRWASVDSYTRNADGQTWTLTALRALTDVLLIRPLGLPIPLADLYHRIRLSDMRRLPDDPA